MLENQVAIQVLLKNINDLLISTPADNDGFLGGKLGAIVYLFYYGRSLDDEIISATANEMVGQYVEELNNGSLKLDFSYCNGLCGFAYAMAHLHHAGFINVELVEEFEDLDEMLFNSAMALINNHYNDFLHGAFGVVHYFSTRDKTQKITFYLEKLSEVIAEKLISIDGFSAIPNLSLPSNKDPNDINLSLSHGQNGFLIILLNLLNENSRVLSTVVKSCLSLVSNTFDQDEKQRFSKFPASIHLQSGEKKYSNRLGWCYGDLGQLLLYERLRKISLSNSITANLDVFAAYTANRKCLDSTLVSDSSFCHGASGLAQFYQVLYLNSGNKVYIDAHHFWIEQTVAMLPCDLKENKFVGKEHSILDGYSGIGLSLLSFLFPQNAGWANAVLLA